MSKRIELQTILETFLPSVYFQPPSNIRMSYPCIVYSKTPSGSAEYANNSPYKRTQLYTITVIEKSPETDLVDRIFEHFNYCSIGSNFIKDNLHHTILNLYF